MSIFGVSLFSTSKLNKKAVEGEGLNARLTNLETAVKKFFGAKPSVGTIIAQKLGVGVGTVNSKAIVEFGSTTAGFLPPRMTTAQRDAISSPPVGLVIFNTSTNKLNVRGASAWEAVTSA